MPIHVVLADPFAFVREAVRTLIEKEPGIEVVGTASEGKEALRLTEQLVPSLLVMEALIDQPSGPEVMQNVKATEVPTRVLVLSRCKKPWMAKKMIKHGACGYFVKDDNPDAVFRAARRASAGEDGLLSEEIARRLFLRRKDERARALSRLTEREEEVMQLVIMGLSNREIAEQLYVTEGTVKNHVSNVLHKLDFSSRTKLIVWAHRQDVPPDV